MKQISLQQTLPHVFSARKETLASDVWLREVAFTKGKRYLVEAASGTGKSSLCSYIYGYRRDYEGTVSFDGRDIRTLSIKEWTRVRKASLSLLFQELRLFPELTVMENIRLKNRLTKHKTDSEITAMLEALGIADKAKEQAGKLSYGQQQRVAFIRCLCQPFDFIFLDEPVSHLDDGNGTLMGRLLTEEAGRQGAGIVVTSIGKHIPLAYDETLRL
ncbi:MAG: ATP-binding cassette domain-containing protein [Prevotellaceae bacterium]|nr:ATP-binding cassette domain-containing protein [Prevotellaceae bacterium]